ncbi:fibronectin type III domain-containing protein [Thermoflavimicrobium daqui]|jgi:chitodextrinase|uniref:Fibronectin type-III domain-containing protein n=1 Tax=Thermoflavimicrobium daqui TaxID=2137476 RepID=A0A364K5A7_9BACL|nr:carbohydrate-binding protein [Thermoflavimicrobium daqui]RAL24564.1 hypothetical protein DL897_09665 [Thermoflavimicrobium daqui]
MTFRKKGKQTLLVSALTSTFIFSVFPTLTPNLVSATAVSSSDTTCQYPAWNATTAYSGGNRVSYNGKNYEAKWWTQGDQPDQSGEWGPWKYISDCSVPDPDKEPPSAPTGLTVTKTTSSSVTLTWKASTDNIGVKGYDVYRGTTLVASVSGTTAEITGLASDTTYTFTVKAKDAAGNVSSASNEITAKTEPGNSVETPRRYVAYASTWNTSLYDLKTENIPNYITNVKDYGDKIDFINLMSYDAGDYHLKEIVTKQSPIFQS